MADNFFELVRQDQIDALQFAASESGRPANLLEKDIWVVWVLSQLFTANLGGHLVFKGGTALSKAYDVIRRFSEDVDLTYDIRQLAPELVGTAEGIDPLPRSRSQGDAWTDKINKELLPAWINDSVMPLLSAATSVFEDVNLQADGCNIYIEYRPLTTPSSYSQPRVRLDFGARSSGEPSVQKHVVCDAATLVPQVRFPEADPRVMDLARIFWEKATAAHVYCLQGERGISHRFSRHFYDLQRMQEAGLTAGAIENLEIAAAVATHKSSFFRMKDETGNVIDYHAAVQGQLRLTPTGGGLRALEQDYEAMVSEGLLLDEARPFQDLLANCAEIERVTNEKMLRNRSLA